MGGTIIEVGTGCGIITIDSLKTGKFEYGIAGDIFASAVQNAAFNAEKLGVKDKSEWYVSDALDSFPTDKKADLLCWNYPFHAPPDNKDIEDLSPI